MTQFLFGRKLLSLFGIASLLWISLFLNVTVDSATDVWATRGNPVYQGLGTTDIIPSPTLANIPGGGVSFVSAGRHNTLFTKSDGTLWASGSNTNGIMGEDVSLEGFSSPVQVEGITGVAKALSAQNGNSAVALKNDGTVWAWGRNDFGQLGITADSSIYQSPVRIQSLTGISDIAITSTGTTMYALKAGEVYAWGSSSEGALGNGSTTDTTTPVLVSGISNAVEISGMDGGALARTGDSKLYTWGGNLNGQLGQDILDPFVGIPASLKNTDGSDMTGFESLADQNRFGPRVIKDGNMWVWGTINGAAAGNDSSNPLTDCQTPNGGNTIGQSRTYPCRGPLVSGISKIGGQAANILTIKDGNVYTSGTNNVGDAGTGTITNSVGYQQISVLSNIVEVEHSGSGGYAVTNNGNVWSWGKNDFYKLGFTQNTSTGLINYEEVGAALSDCKYLHGGVNNFCITQNDELLSWGENVWGGLGQGDREANFTPRPVYTDENNTTRVGDVKQVSSSGRTTSILKNDGSVWVAGIDNQGALGNGPGGATECEHFCEVTYFSSNNIAIDKISNHEISHMALDTDTGRAYYWGWNAFGSSGVDPNDPAFSANFNTGDTAVETPIELPYTDVLDISVRNDRMSYILRDDGGNRTIYGAGANSNCSLGIGTDTASEPVYVAGASGIQSLNVGGDAFALRTDNTIVRWGSGHTTNPICTPEVVNGLNNISKITERIAIDSNGDLYQLLLLSDNVFGVTGSAADYYEYQNVSNVTDITPQYIKADIAEVVLESDIPSLNVMCEDSISGQTAKCTFNVPSNKLLPSNFLMAIGDASTGGSCTIDTAGLATCTGIPVTTDSGNQDIFAQISGGSKIDTGEDNLVNDINNDTDGDGLTNFEELTITGTDPFDANSDNPNTSGVDESLNTQNDGDEDYDDDGIRTQDEIRILQTNPNEADSDSPITTQDESGNGINDGMEDFDTDGLSNFFELYTSFTNPFQADSNGDGTADGDEDADGDGLSNSDEEAAMTNPYSVDSDGDGLSDADELNITLSDPNDPNSDSTQTSNVDESDNSLDDGADDFDGDGYSNLDEIDAGSDPHDLNSIPFSILQDEDIPNLLVSCQTVFVGVDTTCQFVLPASVILPDPANARFIVTVGEVAMADASPTSCVEGTGDLVTCTNVATVDTAAGEYPIRIAYDADNDLSTSDIAVQTLSGDFIETGETAFILDDNTDTNNDGLPDQWQNDNFGDPEIDSNGACVDLTVCGPDADPDEDGLKNSEELFYGTNPNEADSDSDRLTDAEEIFETRTDPNESDSDSAGTVDNDAGNGVNDDQEDLDQDTFTNAQEIAAGTDPLDPSDNPNTRSQSSNNSGSDSSDNSSGGTILPRTGGMVITGLLLGFGAIFTLYSVSQRRKKLTPKIVNDDK